MTGTNPVGLRAKFWEERFPHVDVVVDTENLSSQVVLEQLVRPAIVRHWRAGSNQFIDLVFSDRLVSQEDRKWMDDMLGSVMLEKF